MPRGASSVHHRGPIPRRLTTVPFVAKATGVPLAKIASLLMARHTLAELGLPRSPSPAADVKEAVMLTVQALSPGAGTPCLAPGDCAPPAR